MSDDTEHDRAILTAVAEVRAARAAFDTCALAYRTADRAGGELAAREGEARERMRAAERRLLELAEGRAE